MVWVDSLTKSRLLFSSYQWPAGSLFRCKRGLRQGDSAYLSLGGCSFTDSESCLWGGYSKMLALGTRGSLVYNMSMYINAPPPDLVSNKKVKILIYIFELLSGLSINFHKSSLYQLGLPSLDLSQVSELLHNKMGSFPFIYLGLPLNPTTLSRSNWQPLLDRIEKKKTCYLEKAHTISWRQTNSC